MTVHHWGEDPLGTWILSVLDVPGKPGQHSGKAGLLKNWAIELHGTEHNPQLNWIAPGNFQFLVPLNEYVVSDANPVQKFTPTFHPQKSESDSDMPDSLLLHGCRQVSVNSIYALSSIEVKNGEYIL